MVLTFITPSLPPWTGGISDHSFMLVRELAVHRSVHVLAGYGDYQPVPGAVTTTCFDPMRSSSLMQLREVISQLQPDALWFQYNPLSYARRGTNPYIPLLLAWVRRHLPQVHVVVMVHELSIWPGTWKQKLLSRLQLRQLLWTCRQAHAVCVPVEPWIKTLRQLGYQGPAYWLPVGSNIPLVPTDPNKTRLQIGIGLKTPVLGLFGLTYHHGQTRRLLLALQAAQSVAQDSVLLHVGPRSEEIQTVLGSACRSEGVLPAAEVSARLSCMDLLLLPYPDGVCGRRTAMMAGLEHGCRIVGTMGAVTEDLLRSANGNAMLLSPSENEREWQENIVRVLTDVSLAERLELGARRLFEDNFSWDKIASRAAAVLDGSMTGSLEIS